MIETALEKEDLSPRELAYHITDNQGWFISESSVYRILKSRGLITSPAYIVMAAADEFKDKPSVFISSGKLILPTSKLLAGVGIIWLL